MSETVTKHRASWDWRGFTSLVITLSFILLTATGVIMYISPQGRVANWTGWTAWGLHKDQWAAVHTVTSLLFLIATGFHVYFNWRALVRYIVSKRQFHMKRELAIATTIVILVFAGAAASFPPFGSIVALGDRIKAHWEAQSVQAPYPHAELATLAEFSEQARIPLADLLERLTKAGIEVSNPDSQTIRDLAAARGMTPSELFAAVDSAGTPVASGTGLGQRTLESLCAEEGIPLHHALEILSRHGFAAESQSTMKALAEQKGTTPVQVVDMLRQEASAELSSKT